MTVTNFREACGAQAPLTWIDAAGARLAVMRRGRGFPVVCLHAIGHGARDFEMLANLAGNEYEIVAIDWPGQGSSPPDGTPPGAAHYADIVIAALDALKIERAILIGNSIGGAASIIAAAAKPERVAALVLCDSGGLVKLNGFAKFFIGRMVAFFRAGEQGKQWFPRVYRFYYRRIVLPRRAARAQRERIVAAGMEMAPLLRQAWESFAAPEADIRRLVPTITCPVWIAWARGDRVIPWMLCRAAARRFPNRRVTFFRGGHSAFLENPERFAKGFRAFAKKALK
ncbi:MAG TPA: alpha/beta hydrolase [Rhizomicrobium sp.]|nr:alpha/beta hydrolase [Rhizomicrobium sp.]